MMSSLCRFRQRLTAAELALIAARKKDKTAPKTSYELTNPDGLRCPLTKCTFQTDAERLAKCGTVLTLGEYSPDKTCPTTYYSDNSYAPDRLPPVTFCSLYNP